MKLVTLFSLLGVLSLSAYGDVKVKKSAALDKLTKETKFVLKKDIVLPTGTKYVYINENKILVRAEKSAEIRNEEVPYCVLVLKSAVDKKITLKAGLEWSLKSTDTDDLDFIEKGTVNVLDLKKTDAQHLVDSHGNQYVLHGDKKTKEKFIMRCAQFTIDDLTYRKINVGELINGLKNQFEINDPEVVGYGY